MGESFSLPACGTTGNYWLFVEFRHLSSCRMFRRILENSCYILLQKSLGNLSELTTERVGEFFKTNKINSLCVIVGNVAMKRYRLNFI
jgi:hypothetical protein